MITLLILNGLILTWMYFFNKDSHEYWVYTDDCSFNERDLEEDEYWTKGL